MYIHVNIRFSWTSILHKFYRILTRSNILISTPHILHNIQSNMMSPNLNSDVTNLSSNFKEKCCTVIFTPIDIVQCALIVKVTYYQSTNLQHIDSMVLCRGQDEKPWRIMKVQILWVRIFKCITNVLGTKLRLF